MRPGGRGEEEEEEGQQQQREEAEKRTLGLKKDLLLGDPDNKVCAWDCTPLEIVILNHCSSTTDDSKTVASTSSPTPTSLLKGIDLCRKPSPNQTLFVSSSFSTASRRRPARSRC
jgi:hypothetical protein